MHHIKHNMRPNFALSLLVFFTLTVSADELNLPYLKCDITLSKDKIISGEPVDICFLFTNTSQGQVSFRLFDCCPQTLFGVTEPEKPETIRISVCDSLGKSVPPRERWCHPYSQTDVCYGRLLPGEKEIVKYPLHLRVSTCLEPGKYTVTIESYAINHGYLSPEYLKSIGSGPKIMESSKLEDYSGPSLMLEVEPNDKQKLDAVYETVFQEALAYVPLGWRGDDYADIGSSNRTILWAEGPAAVPYQIALIYDKGTGFRYWPPAIVSTWDNIVRYATLAQVEEVLEIARNPKCLKNPQIRRDYSAFYTPGLAWAIHQWHKNGSDAVREITRELAEKLTDEDPCPSIMEAGIWPYGKP